MAEIINLEKKGKFILREELLREYSPYIIKTFVREGVISKVNNKYYQNNSYSGEESDLYYCQAFIPNGVVCLMSAAVYYGLSTFRPMSVDVAVCANSYVPGYPDWPPVALHYFERKNFDFAVRTVNEDGNIFRIYEIEKVVADIIKYREKIGIEETKEILINYLGRPDRNISRLIEYSKRIGCDRQVRTYLEVLVE